MASFPPIPEGMKARNLTTGVISVNIDLSFSVASKAAVAHKLSSRALIGPLRVNNEHSGAVLP